ncbi:MAG: Lrp/AsnC family transcriptional regulator [Phaeodactylibacter sp.]|nr:Lrp/AsnC family transcriptional regulator [Phaeodactylibacter sp.]
MKERNNNLDEFDQQLVKWLQKDGRMSFTDIASKLNVAVSTVRNRYKKLVDDKVLHILGWVDPTKSSYNSYSRVTIEIQPSSMIEEVASRLAEVEEVSFLAITSGPADIEVNVMCRDNKHLLEVMREKIHAVKGVHRTTSTVYYEVRKWASHDVPTERKLENGKQ